MSSSDVRPNRLWYLSGNEEVERNGQISHIRYSNILTDLLFLLILLMNNGSDPRLPVYRVETSRPFIGQSSGVGSMAVRRFKFTESLSKV